MSRRISFRENFFHQLINVQKSKVNPSICLSSISERFSTDILRNQQLLLLNVINFIIQVLHMTFSAGFGYVAGIYSVHAVGRTIFSTQVCIDFPYFKIICVYVSTIAIYYYYVTKVKKRGNIFF